MGNGIIKAEVNQFPSLTWHHLHINHGNFEGKIESPLEAEVRGIGEGTSLFRKSSDLVYGFAVHSETQMGKEFDSLLDKSFLESGIQSYEFEVSGKSQENVKLSYKLESNRFCASDIVIHAAENSESSFVIDFSSARDASGLFGLRVRVFAEKNAKVNIAWANLLGKDAVSFVAFASKGCDNSSVGLSQLDLGGCRTFAGGRFSLDGYRANSSCLGAYFVNGEKKSDVNYVAHQSGRETRSEGTFNSVLLDKAEKTWRGSIVFPKGCVDSAGEEKENVLLFNPEIVNRSMPVILCDEEAVEGHHGSSIGKIDPEVLLYLGSRGISEKEAKALIIRSRINEIAHRINDEELVDSVQDFIEGVL